MGSAPPAPTRRRDRVVPVLLGVGLVASWPLAFVTHAPNRIVAGRPIGLVDGLGAWAPWFAAAIVAIAVATLMEPRRWRALAVAALATLVATGLLALAAVEATTRAATAAPAARTALGGAFWVDVGVLWLIFAEAIRRAALPPGSARLAGLIFFLPALALLASGRLDDLSILREYANRRDVFADAALRHVEIVALTLAASLALGVPLGVFAFRRPRWRAATTSVLGIVQTIPSIALFGLLMAPLAALATAVPVLARVGIAGIGLAPAVVALTLYSLLPIVRGVVAGLGRAPEATLEAARGIGFGPSRIFWRVEVPLALPVLLSGLRVSLVQTIGIAMVAALIGAGGFGAILFQGLAGGALDLVLLAVVPVVAMAAIVDAAFRAVTTRFEERVA